MCSAPLLVVSLLTQLTVVSGEPVCAQAAVGLESVHTGAAVSTRVTGALVHLYKVNRIFSFVLTTKERLHGTSPSSCTRCMNLSMRVHSRKMLCCILCALLLKKMTLAFKTTVSYDSTPVFSSTGTRLTVAQRVGDGRDEGVEFTEAVLAEEEVVDRLRGETVQHQIVSALVQAWAHRHQNDVDSCIDETWSFIMGTVCDLVETLHTDQIPGTRSAMLGEV